MKKFYLLLIIPVALIISANSCLKNPAEPEPGGGTGCTNNNSFECASPIEIGSLYSDKLTTNDDVNYYQISLTQDAVIEVAITNVPSVLNLDVSVYDNNHWKIAYNYTSGLGQNVFINTLQKAGTYFIRVEDRDNNSSSENKYNIQVTKDITDVYEMNNEYQDAKNFVLGSNYNAKFRPNNDVDIFQFTTSQGGVIEATVSQVPSNIDIEMTLRDNQHWTLVGSYNTGLGQTAYISSVQKPGLYFINVRDRENNASSTSFYNLQISLDNTDTYEYNNTFSDSKQININTDVFGKIRNKEDIDYYQFVLTSTGNVSVSVPSVPANIDMDVTVYGSNQWSIASSTNTGVGVPVTLLVNNLSAGTYYVSLKDGNNDAESSQFYTLRVNK